MHVTTFEKWFYAITLHRTRDTRFDEAINRVISGEDEFYVLRQWLEDAFEAGYDQGCYETTKSTGM